jgi:hypothetical protein
MLLDFRVISFTKYANPSKIRQDNLGGVRELHWHKEAEWAYMLNGEYRRGA